MMALKDTIHINNIPKFNLSIPSYKNGFVYCKGCNARYYNIPPDIKYCPNCNTQLRRTPKKKKRIKHDRI
jgi:rRNA maturation endonuclease Nob1